MAATSMVNAATTFRNIGCISVSVLCHEPRGDRVLYHWTFVGTNTGPGGTGNRVRISGYEDWKIGPDGLIADSKGRYDAQDWDRQVKRH